jgi:hypothetical protein
MACPTTRNLPAPTDKTRIAYEQRRQQLQQRRRRTHAQQRAHQNRSATSPPHTEWGGGAAGPQADRATLPGYALSVSTTS